MDILSLLEVRILGSLIEKELTTPEYYPLSLNALTNACNQKSNRDPVMSIDETTVARVLEELRYKKLIWKVTITGGKVAKYKHNISTIHEFSLPEVSILCELFLRGPQTLGELRTHCARFHEFQSLEAVEAVLQGLAASEKGLFVQKLPREFGRKECRYAHLFCGPVKVDDTPPPEAAVIEVQAENKRIEALEQEVSALKAELGNLRDQFYSFKKQFEE